MRPYGWTPDQARPVNAEWHTIKAAYRWLSRQLQAMIRDSQAMKR